MEQIRILVVEDDPDINGLLCAILKEGGYESRSAFFRQRGVVVGGEGDL